MPIANHKIGNRQSAIGNRLKLAGKKVLVIGAARSGIACAKFLAARGATVALNDGKPIEKWSPEACRPQR